MPVIDLPELFRRNEDLTGLTAIVVAEIESGDLTILKLVEILGPWLTDTDKNQRKQGTSLLACVLKLISPRMLEENECLFMVKFFCDRLQDHFTIAPHALEGLVALSTMDNFCDESPVEIIKAFQENITCQALTQPQRQNFYLILHNLLQKKSKKISAEFPGDYLYTLISGMDSESDPRNLLFLFSFLPKAFTEIPLNHLTEEAFAVLECYFPVDFTPVEEKGDVTREDLARGLEDCLVANPAFAEYYIPVICEKMESSLRVAQMDSLKLIIRASKSWSLEPLNPFIKRLWYSIKDVLIPGNDQEVTLLAGEALTSLLDAFSRTVLSESLTETLTFLLESIISSTHCYLNNPSLSLFLPTLTLLHKIIAVSSTTAVFILSKILPQLLALLEVNSDQSDVILKALSPILVSSVKFDCWESGDLNLPTHIRCFAHTLNLCATTDQNKIILSSKTMVNIHKKIVDKCNVLWKATSKPKTAEIVQRVLGRALSKPGITRWNSLFDALKIIEKSKDKYFKLAEELNLCKSLILSQSDFIYLQEFITCSKPIAEALDILQGEEYTFFGIAIPTLLSLRRKLEVLTQQQWSYCNDLAEGHLQSVINRFKDYFDFSSVQSQNAAIASVSHPEFKNRWFKCIEEHHKEKIMQLFKAAVAAHTLTRVENQLVSNDPTTSGSKSKSYFDFGDEIDENISSTASSELEILRFFADKSATNLKSLHCFPAIKSVFLEYNTPLPSSAPVERLFSWATITNQAKTNRLSDEHFEIRVVLKANAKFFDELS